MRNWQLIDQVEFYIHLHKKSHDQGEWLVTRTQFFDGPVRVANPKGDCGVKACVAGWATLLAPGQEWVNDDGVEFLIAQPGEYPVTTVVLPGEGETALTTIEVRARRLLGLDGDDIVLFAGEKRRKHIRNILNEWRADDRRPQRDVKAEVKAYRKAQAPPAA